MGRGTISWWWDGWVADCADGRCDFPLVLFSCMQKMTIWRVEQGCERMSSRSGGRWIPSYKRARVYNNFKSEHLLLKRKVEFDFFFKLYSGQDLL